MTHTLPDNPISLGAPLEFAFTPFDVGSNGTSSLDSATHRDVGKRKVGGPNADVPNRAIEVSTRSDCPGSIADDRHVPCQSSRGISSISVVLLPPDVPLLIATRLASPR